MWFNSSIRQAPKLSKILLSNRHFNCNSLTAGLDLKTFNSKISKLMKNGLVEEARELFDEMPRKNTVTYNAMIKGYFQNGFFESAVFLYNQMPFHDIFSYNTVICGLMNNGDVKGAEDIFERMGYQDVVTWNSMISGYVNNGLMDDAVRVFNQMSLKDVVSWNSLIGGFVKNKEFHKAEEFFRIMGFRDIVTWTIMLKASLEACGLVEARKFFQDMPIKDVQAWNTMIIGYLKNRRVEIAEGLFQKMPEKDWISWITMIDGFMSNGRIDNALRLFNEMPRKCEKTWNSILLAIVRNGLVKEAHAVVEKSSLSGIVSWTNIMKGYFDAGEVVDAIKVFELMTSRDTTVWNVAIFGLDENDRGEDGIKLFIKMKQDRLPLDEVTHTSFLAICSSLPSLNLGKQIHAEAIKAGIDRFISTSNALITMYFRCGHVYSALLEFYSMASHDTISWNSVICGLAHHGQAEDAIMIFEKMRLSTVEPNQITFVGVLSACSHAGLVEHGKFYFSVMRNEYFIQSTNEHYTSIVDLLGRIGRIDEALNILRQMIVHGLEVCASIWGALLGGCRMHKNTAMAKICGEKILELEPSNSGVYIILGEMYLASGMKDEAEKIWLRMKNAGVKKQPGCSWVESSSGGKVFLSGDKTHPEFENLSCVLNLMYVEMEVGISRVPDEHILGAPVLSGTLEI
ncbi:pentatricopeptide repeat-containing protein-like [Dorcoceras hygrometricum]|uniref:Pentatricopeptide repeat-containing protein-like n=1 Tax=Dorcoceras hygrometricum TaxID=472368 RepID=A0A2Z7BQ29_9LAMI|nr:pentatricopeptide repeat-containing protein-like [Dorcoceras hygrometricum]